MEEAIDHTENLAQEIQDASDNQEQTEIPTNFWNPLNFEEILNRFPKMESYNHKYQRSFLYQPERVSLNSHDAQVATNPIVAIPGISGVYKNYSLPLETFSQFTILFEKPLLRVKSLQLLSAIIPNPQPSIPDDECAFYYYRLRNLYSSVNNNGSGGTLWNASYTYYRAGVVVSDQPSALLGTTTIFYSAWASPDQLSLYTNDSPSFISVGNKVVVTGTSVPQYNTVFTVLQVFTAGGKGNWRILVSSTTNSLVTSGTIQAYAAQTVQNYYVSITDSNLNNAPFASPTNWVSVGQSGDTTVLVYPPWDPTTNFSNGTTVFYTSTDGYTYFYLCILNSQGNQPDISPLYWTQVSRSVSTSPNWFDIQPGLVAFNRLWPSTVPPDIYNPTTVTNATTARNTTFPDYPTFVNALNATNQSAYSCQIPGDILFTYNETLNKIQWVPQNQLAWVNGVFNNGYYYLYIGWNDPNYKAMASLNTLNQKYGYTLNLRSGFTWNGEFSLPSNPWNGFYGNLLFATQIANYFTPFAGSNQQGGPSIYSIFATNPTKSVVTANSYPDLVYTQSIRLYCDLTQGSTQDSAGNAGLLSVVPLSATSLGVTFYQNNFNNPLTKVPEQILSITIVMKTDSGDDYVLPSSASVSFELGIQYE
jgi:hypothetical protein